MSVYIVSKVADNDIEDIATYIARDNINMADKQIDLFTEKFILLANNPFIGRNREDLFAGLRSFPLGNYIIFYRLLENDIEIVRVLNAARDVESLF